jgi:hypothetical protein
MLHDLCNRLKHRSLSWPKTDIGPFSMTFTIEVAPDGAYQRLKSLEAKVNGETMCMYELAEQAILAWIAYFRAHPALQPASESALAC